MAEDHGLGDGDGSVDVTEGLELLLLGVAQHIVLFDSIQCFLLSLQLDDVGIRYNALQKQHLAVFGHLIQNKHLDLLGVYELELTAPVQHGTRCANNNLGLTFISSDSVDKFDLRIVFAHLLNHLTSLKCQFIGR
uniref:Uncharacterized protein n=1 Tax=Mastacembelus armatus TaxID=205130 RepID=A0A3Q3SHG1_9TELE